MNVYIYVYTVAFKSLMDKPVTKLGKGLRGPGNGGR